MSCVCMSEATSLKKIYFLFDVCVIGMPNVNESSISRLNLSLLFSGEHKNEYPKAERYKIHLNKNLLYYKHAV